MPSRGLRVLPPCSADPGGPRVGPERAIKEPGRWESPVFCPQDRQAGRTWGGGVLQEPEGEGQADVTRVLLRVAHLQ